KPYHVIKTYQSPYPNPVIFNKGDSVIIGKEFHDIPDWKDWVWCKYKTGCRAWIPKQYLVISGNLGILNRDYNARELSVEPGEIISIFEIINGFGMAEKSDGDKGWVPLNHLEILNENIHET
ncbi:MAG: hypothetical protein JXR87_05275, partial [Candidatus Marinimicrobia bacterium]|nr:hypothetical protein [Candidatus Neomarinimicrobiota bacterium]